MTGIIPGNVRPIQGTQLGSYSSTTCTSDITWQWLCTAEHFHEAQLNKQNVLLVVIIIQQNHNMLCFLHLFSTLPNFVT